MSDQGRRNGYLGEMDDFNNLNLSRQTITRQIAELSAEIEDYVFKSQNRFIFSVLFGESV